jgi:AcrR family transcriptional regulator
MRDLAARLGMEKGSLYYYIEGKEDLLFEILRRGHLQGLSFVSEGPDAGVATPPERLEALIRRWMDGRLHMPASLDVAEFDLRYLSPDRRAEILSLRRAISQVATDIISAGVAEGYFDQSVDPQVASSTTFRILSSTLTWYRPRGDVSWSDLTDWYVRLVIGGLKPAGPDPRPL